MKWYEDFNWDLSDGEVWIGARGLKERVADLFPLSVYPNMTSNEKADYQLQVARAGEKLICRACAYNGDYAAYEPMKLTDEESKAIIDCLKRNGVWDHVYDVANERW